MSETRNVNGIANTGNLALCNVALERAVSRPGHLPGIVCFYGPVGWGKSISSNRVANQRDAYYVQCGSEWKKKFLMQRILTAMGVEFRAGDTVAGLIDKAAEELWNSRKPLIIDEFNHVVKNRAVELVRDLYEGSRAAIMVVGEENLPGELARGNYRQFVDRTQWIEAQPVDIADARKLCHIYCPDVAIDDDLLERVVDVSKGAARNVCKNIEYIRQETLNAGDDEVNTTSWGSRGLITNTAPKWNAAKWGVK